MRTIDDIPMLRDLVVPEGIFSSALTAKPGKRGEGSRTMNSTVKRMYAPFPSHPTRRARSNDTPPPPPLPCGPSSVVGIAAAFSGPHDALLPPPPDAFPAGAIPLHPPPDLTSAALPFFPTPEVNWYS